MKMLPPKTSEHSELNLEACERSKIERFATVFAKTPILDGWQDSVYASAIIVETAFYRCSLKIYFEKFNKNSQEIICAGVRFFAKLYWQPATLLKKTTSQLFSSEFCEMFQNKFFKKTSGRMLLEFPKKFPFQSYFC